MPSAEPSASLELSQIPESAWAIANARFTAIEPLIAGNYSRAAVEEQAAAVGVDVSTLYRWLKKFRKLPHTRGVREGESDPRPFGALALRHELSISASRRARVPEFANQPG